MPFYYPHLFLHAVDGVVDPIHPERSGLNEAACYNYSMRKMWVIERRHAVPLQIVTHRHRLTLESKSLNQRLALF